MTRRTAYTQLMNDQIIIAIVCAAPPLLIAIVAVALNRRGFRMLERQLGNRIKP
jgi:hypothetical protein